MSLFSQALSENGRSFIPWLFQCKKEKVGKGRKEGRKEDRKKEKREQESIGGKDRQGKSYNKSVT